MRLYHIRSTAIMFVEHQVEMHIMLNVTWFCIYKTVVLGKVISIAIVNYIAILNSDMNKKEANVRFPTTIVRTEDDNFPIRAWSGLKMIWRSIHIIYKSYLAAALTWYRETIKSQTGFYRICRILSIAKTILILYIIPCSLGITANVSTKRNLCKVRLFGRMVVIFVKVDLHGVPYKPKLHF